MALTHRTSLAPRRPPRERALTPPPEYPACAPAFQHKSAQRHARGRDALITDVHKECFSSRYTPKCSLQATHASKTSLFPSPPPLLPRGSAVAAGCAHPSHAGSGAGQMELGGIAGHRLPLQSLQLPWLPALWVGSGDVCHPFCSIPLAALWQWG